MSDGKQTVLVVDDIADNIDLLVEVLKENYHVKAALNGEQALRLAHMNLAPDLILLDVMMLLRSSRLLRQTQGRGRTISPGLNL